MPLIYAHRGVWASRNQQNSIESIESARVHGFGLETDFRSRNKKLVISHDPLLDHNTLTENLFDFSGIPVALNIKEDGLSDLYEEFFGRNPHPYSFLFDGSIPEMIKIREKGLPHALRLSEYERQTPWETKFLWIDGFHSDWWKNSEEIEDYMHRKTLVFVSPELHGREFKNTWDYFKKLKSTHENIFGVCTDHPAELRDFLNE
ncbi:hypothetical protein MCEMRE212_00052 [Candidatus Nanopelagicaceae bacterium]